MSAGTSIWRFARDPAGVLQLLACGAAHGVHEATLLAGSRLRREQLDDPNAELSPAQELKVIDNLLRALGRPPGLGLQIGLGCHFSTFGMWGYGLICSANLGQAVDMALRYIHLTFAYSVIEKVVRGDEVRLNFSPPDIAPGLRRFVVEREMGTALALMQDAAGPGFRLTAFHLQAGRGRIHQVPERLRQIGGVAVTQSDAPCHLAFDRRWLDFRPATANPTTAAMCEQVCQRLLERRQAAGQVSEMLRDYLAVSTAPVLPTLAALSQLTHASPRTLKRRLREEGSGFRELVNQQRAQLAAELVGGSDRPLAEIAERLGYASPSCFSQAFRRWHGRSPSAYRQDARAAQSERTASITASG